MSYTRGPWSVGGMAMEGGRPYGINIAGADGYHVAKVSTRSAMNGENAYGGENRYNALLIAAAPELLDALRYARRFLRPEDHDVSYVDYVIDKASGHPAATAKAEGR